MAAFSPLSPRITPQDQAGSTRSENRESGTCAGRTVYPDGKHPHAEYLSMRVQKGHALQTEESLMRLLDTELVKQLFAPLMESEENARSRIEDMREDYEKRKPESSEEALEALRELRSKLEVLAVDLEIPVTEIEGQVLPSLPQSNFQSEYVESARSLINGMDQKCRKHFETREAELVNDLVKTPPLKSRNILGKTAIEAVRAQLKCELLETYLLLAETYKHFSGSVMIHEKGQKLLEKGYGKSSGTIPNAAQTVIHAGSVTKQFTAAAILLLQQEGSLDIHHVINPYLPKQFRCSAWKDVTIHHLLSHTGGIVDYTTKTNSNTPHQGFLFGKALKDAVYESQLGPLDFEPGSKINYCNLGYTLLGLIIEKVSGGSYEEFVQNRLLGPLGMSSSGIHTMGYDSSNHRYAKGHGKWDETLNQHAPNDHSLAVTAADGGLFTTTEDLYKWSQMLADKNEVFLTKESMEKMTTPTAQSIAEGWPYGYGLGVDNALGKRRVHHSGWIPGFKANHCLYPKEDIHISLLCNNTHAFPWDISTSIERIILSINALSSEE